ncbi:MAG: site-specific integrase [Alphaproteobacteria bacterium]|nr:site-specific integrase [Alphaproteobacteria bacterium]QQS57140.1 MAG: site-specific integrase [Alphaproteobacteria bacterium]
MAKALEYHTSELIAELDMKQMDHAEIMALLKGYYAEVLERTKSKLDKSGPLPKQNIQNLQNALNEWEVVSKEDADDIMDLMGAEYEDPSYDPIKDDLVKIMEHHGLSFAPDSDEYQLLRKNYKHVKRAYIRDLLAYNQSVTDFSLNITPHNTIKAIHHHKPENKLESVILAYMDEIKSGLTKRSYTEQYDCLKYLIDWLGKDYQIGHLDSAKVQEAKALLRFTPKGRNKAKLTAGKALTEQIQIAKENGLEIISNSSVNKYLSYFESLFEWAKRNSYISENPFKGIRIKAEKKKARRREMFDKNEVAKIIMGLSDDNLVKNKSNYWGALIAVYTGARRNEIAGLLPDDVKQDTATGIWYFDITDEEEEGKALKTSASKRVVPVHSALLDQGFLQFVEEARGKQGQVKHEGGYEPRLLYDLTYTEHEKWGRNLGRWFNERYLKVLGLKSEKKTLHSLRHSFITYLSAAGVDEANIKSLVGHEPDTVTTQIYTHYGVEHLPTFKDAIEKLPY